MGFSESTFYSLSFIELIIQPPADLDTSLSKMNEGKLTLNLIKHPKLDSSLISIGLRCFPKPSVDRRFQIPTNGISWNVKDEFETGEISEEISDSVMVQVLLSINGKTVRRHVIHDLNHAINPKYQAYQFFDADIKKLKEALDTEKNSKGFENAVAIVFHLLGFYACGFLETEAPDIILFSPRGRIILVECTILTHDIRTKAGKLHHRKKEIQEKIKVDFPWIDVEAVLVCNLQRNKITEDDYVEKNNIILYCKEDIQSALEYLPLISDPDEMIDRALEKLAKNTNKGSGIKGSASISFS